MLFNSVEFLLFFPIVTLVYFLVPHKFRWFLLLTASCIFYMAFIPKYILILLLTILVDFYAARYIESERGKKKKVYLIISIISTCAILFVFKYFNFFNENMDKLARMIHWNYPLKTLTILLPIGLSFHTFQSLSYVIEVYKGRQKAERHLGIYSLYVMFYPQLVAGPIERPQNLLHQFREKHYFEYDRVVSGLRLMLWGFFKKIVIADRMAVYVNSVYNHPADFSGTPAAYIVSTVFFAIQIYNDFSGYTDIARGAARVMGFELMENFKSPYFSTSVPEFWKRWHRSLSTWFKDYVYIPLGGNRVSKVKVYRNLLITFMISGIWHGANWTFVIWGTLNGVYMVLSQLTRNLREKITKRIYLEKIPILPHVIRIGFTFSLICLAWVFFRARNLSEACFIIGHMVGALQSPDKLLADFEIILNKNLISFALIGCMFMIHMVRHYAALADFKPAIPLPLRWVGYYALILGILLLGVLSHQEFIYFQF